MLSDKEKAEMLEDGLSWVRRDDFLEAARRKPKMSRELNAYIAFLTAVQDIKPFAHRRTVTVADKNIL